MSFIYSWRESSSKAIVAQSQGGQAVSESVNNYISGINRVISETPISDSTPHNIADLGMLCRRLERKLAATRKYLSEVTERAKRMEEAGDALCENSNPSRWDLPEAAALKLTEQSNWLKAKEAKP
jgi:hypothetical protein